MKQRDKKTCGQINRADSERERNKYVYVYVYKIRKAILVTGRGGPSGCETSRIPHFLHSRLTDGGEAVGLTRRPSFTPSKIPGTHFC
jgi:hypothetical protein